MLYNKHRPKYFKDLIGQELTKNLLINFLTNKEDIHSFIFYGPNGTGKTTTARLFSQAINCSKFSENKELCRNCEYCQAIEKRECTDLIEIDGATHNGVEYIREMIKNSVYPPLLLSKKIYVIDEAHCLSYQAWNALLKLIEEPPSHLILIFLTTAIHKIIPTILSRCQKLFFSPIQYEDLNQLLSNISKAENREITSEIISKLSENSKGSAREAIVSLEKLLTDTQTSNEELLQNLSNLEEESLELLDLICSSNYLQAIEKIKKNLTNSNRLFELTLDRLLELSFYQLSSSKEVLSSISEDRAQSLLKQNPNLNKMINFLAPSVSTGTNIFSFSYSKYLLVNLFECCHSSFQPTINKLIKEKAQTDKKQEIPKVVQAASSQKQEQNNHESLSLGALLSEAIVQKTKVSDLPKSTSLFRHSLIKFESVDLPQFKFSQLLANEKEIILLLRKADKEVSKEYYSLLNNYLKGEEEFEQKDLVVSQLFENMISKYELICSKDFSCIVVFSNESKSNYFNLKVKNLDIKKKLHKIFNNSINWKGITLLELQSAIRNNKSFKVQENTTLDSTRDTVLLQKIQKAFLSKEETKFVA
ncbi:DNA polymerase III subunit gamma/tau [Mycoplasma ovis str. Michigan]|uniref:DNA polymerase III subunit gamma/tau n=1 Tax=Mycoplasma ovis str. Michigan TaxID=1415773 RepID=A0ABM5P030_9MOLU|nr:DNA polymerase III subunit gamma/tau [Mycoplasma ovis]AHC39792.1 DNA polymerase III subunit gamma/tau [Mycoplasma ovis str. Michigan]